MRYLFFAFMALGVAANIFNVLYAVLAEHNYAKALFYLVGLLFTVVGATFTWMWARDEL